MIRVLAPLAGAAVLAVAGAVTAQGPVPVKPDVAKGQAIATQVCAACHGPDGNSIAPANPNNPKLAGQIPEYLSKQLANFKPRGGNKPERENAIMAGMVANLSEPDLRSVAAFFAGQALKPASARDKQLAAEGQRLWRGGNAATGVPACAGCHGPAGAGMPAQYPRLSGQYGEYIEAQLKSFKAGQRANDPNRMMRDVAERMSEREMRAVAEYAAALR